MCKAAELSREQVKTIEKPNNATANVHKAQGHDHRKVRRVMLAVYQTISHLCVLTRQLRTEE